MHAVMLMLRGVMLLLSGGKGCVMLLLLGEEGARCSAPAVRRSRCTVTFSCCQEEEGCYASALKVRRCTVKKNNEIPGFF